MMNVYEGLVSQQSLGKKKGEVTRVISIIPLNHKTLIK